MKKRLLLIPLIALILTNCEIRKKDSDKSSGAKVETALNYKTGVIVDKKGDGKQGEYFLFVRFKGKDEKYHISSIRVPKFEFDNYSLGDTIK